MITESLGKFKVIKPTSCKACQGKGCIGLCRPAVRAPKTTR